MQIIDSKVVKDKLYVLYQKSGGNYLALELILKDYEISFGFNPMNLSSTLTGPNFSGEANFKILSIQAVPQEWAERMQQPTQLPKATPQIEGPKLQIEYKAEEAEWKEI